MRIPSCLLSLQFLVLAPGVAEAQQFPSDQDLTVMLEYLVEDGPAVGIVLGVLEADGSTRVVSYGSPGPDARPLGSRSVFGLGSMTKAFTGTLLADMVARGEVSLSDPVAKHLPDDVSVPSRGGREITLLDLATHHSGLPKNPDNMSPADPANPYADYSVEQLYAFLSSHELRYDPGSKPEYSNLGMGLLGHGLARAAGKNFKDLVRERILEPLGMDTTGYTLEGEMTEWVTAGHDGEGNVVPLWDVDILAGAGGLRSNVEDLLTFLAANIGPPATDLEEAMRDAHAVQKRLNDEWGMGLGWQVRNEGDRRLVQHGGGTAGFSTMLGFDPDKRVGFVRLTNSGGFDDDIGMDFLRRGAVERTEVEVPEETLAAYVGEYEFTPSFSIVVRLEKGALSARWTGQVRFRLYAEAETKFFFRRTDAQVTFTKDAAGAVVGMILHREATPDQRARKVR